MSERRPNILDTAPRGNTDPLTPRFNLRHCWIYGSGPTTFKNIQVVSDKPIACHESDWVGFIPDGREFVEEENVTFVHSCSEQRRLQKSSLKGTTKVWTYFGIAYVTKRDEVFE